MLDYLLQYGLFLAETLTVVAAVAAVILLVAALAARRRGGSGPERLEVRDLGARYRDMKQILENGLLGAKERKAAAKARKREAKARRKTPVRPVPGCSCSTSRATCARAPWPRCARR